MNDIFTIIIDKDPTANETTKLFLEDNSKIKNVKQFLKLEDGYDYICKNKPNLIFIDMAYGEEVTLDIISKIKKDNKDCRIVLLSNELDAQTIIKAMKMGASDNIEKPILKKDFDKVITKLVNEINYKADDVHSKIISIFSNKGGVGKTTIATNLAINIAQITKEPTVIVDFNSQFGDVSTFLDVKTEFGISYILKNKEKVNKEFLLSTLPQYKDSNLYVLSDLFYINDVKDLTLENVQDIIDSLKSTFKYIIMDITNVFDLKTIKILDNSDEILFPLVANIPNLRNCSRCLQFFNKIGYDADKIKLILNRLTPNDEIKVETIESTLNKKIYAKIMNNYFIVMAAINRGVGIDSIDKDADIAKSYQNLAYSIIKNNKEE